MYMALREQLYMKVCGQSITQFLVCGTEEIKSKDSY